MGYHVAYVKTFYDVQTIQQTKDLLDTFDVAGLILLGTIRDESIDHLREHYSPIVTVTDMRGVEDDAVLFDGVNGMTLMVEHLATLGYRCPGYISGSSEFTFPPLTTINVHKMLLGEVAAERIVRRIENPDEVYLKITVPTSLVIRQSCGSKS